MLFISLIVGLFVCSEALTLLATRAATTVKGGVSVGNGIKVEAIEFFYKMDAQARYLDLKNDWQANHRGEISLEQAESLATEAYQKASVESQFKRWLYHGGASPNIFKGKLHLYNTANKAMLNVPVNVKVRVKVGDLRVNPGIQMTDFGHLKKSGRWETLKVDNKKIDALAPGEDMLIDVMSFHLLSYLKTHPNQWPTEVEVTVSSPQFDTTRQSLELVPDHFVVPILY